MARINGKLYTLIIFDVDGTLVKTKSGKTFRVTPDDWEWLPNRIERIQEINRAGDTHFAIASNQGGVAFGYFSSIDILNELARMCEEVKCISAKGLFVCMTHPNASDELYRAEDDRRKPGPGMLLEAMATFSTFGMIAPRHTLMVGDRPEDEQAAQAAGCDFMWAYNFFGD